MLRRHTYSTAYKNYGKLSYGTGVVVGFPADFLQNTLTKQFTTEAKPL